VAGGGVVAVGDSIVHGGFTRHQFVAPESWAKHLADIGGWPFTNHARGLATSGQVVDEQLPLIVRDDYDVGAVTVAANDLQFEWHPERFEANLEAILTRLGDAADRVVVTTVPPNFRRLPGEDRRIKQAVPAANDIIVRLASDHGAHVVDLSDFTSHRWMRPDRAHPTALGLAEIGQRAAEAVGLERTPADARRLGVAYSLRHGAGLAWHSAWLSMARLRRHRADSPRSGPSRFVEDDLNEAIEALYPRWRSRSDDAATTEYLVVPHVRNPRVLVPVSSRRVAVSSVHRCSLPQSSLSRLRREAVLLALAVGAAPLLLRDRLRLPHDEGSIDAYLEDALERELVLSLYIGPARANRKPVFQVLSPDGETLGFAKVGTRPLTRDLVRSEATTLAALSRTELNHVRVPRVLHSGQWRGHEVLVQSALPTWAARARLTEEARTAGEREIAALLGITHGHLATSAYWEDLRDRLGNLVSAEGQALAKAAGRLVERHPDLDLQYGAWHGDWTPWNMASTSEGLLVWDWERFTTGVPLGFDAFHHDLHCRLQSGVPGSKAADQTIHRATKTLRSLKLTDEGAVVTALLYLLDLGARYAHDRDAEPGRHLDGLGSWLLPTLVRRVGTV
jgi:lysophospholipase L1-like esterase